MPDKVIEYIGESWPDADLAGWTGPGWYFWVEDWTHCCGPFETPAEASAALEKYVEVLG